MLSNACPFFVFFVGCDRWFCIPVGSLPCIRRLISCILCSLGQSRVVDLMVAEHHPDSILGSNVLKFEVSQLLLRRLNDSPQQFCHIAFFVPLTIQFWTKNFANASVSRGSWARVYELHDEGPRYPWPARSHERSTSGDHRRRVAVVRTDVPVWLSLQPKSVGGGQRRPRNSSEPLPNTGLAMLPRLVRCRCWTGDLHLGLVGMRPQCMRWCAIVALLGQGDSLFLFFVALSLHFAFFFKTSRDAFCSFTEWSHLLRSKLHYRISSLVRTSWGWPKGGSYQCFCPGCHCSAHHKNLVRDASGCTKDAQWLEKATTWWRRWRWRWEE